MRLSYRNFIAIRPADLNDLAQNLDTAGKEKTPLSMRGFVL